jgi:hypothetical protein
MIIGHTGIKFYFRAYTTADFKGELVTAAARILTLQNWAGRKRNLVNETTYSNELGTFAGYIIYIHII